ncbi:alpha/beta fold hydrolase [Flavisphingomonas formosensis]|uniref:alpha/beta fold hydrolase n=1 Tax=Flavisphingomonas formosensis TaxID=861534 RepID=UPI0012FBF3A0|nr:hypothetical protein [Sphingomonas formosensis]
MEAQDGVRDGRGVQRVCDCMCAYLHGFPKIGEVVAGEVAAAVAACDPHCPLPTDLEGLRCNPREGNDGHALWHWDPRLAEEDLAAVWGTMDRSAPTSANPLLLIRDGESEIVDAAGVARLREAVPDLQIMQVAGASHMLAADCNAAFNVASLPFLDDQFAAEQRSKADGS